MKVLFTDVVAKLFEKYLNLFFLYSNSYKFKNFLLIFAKINCSALFILLNILAQSQNIFWYENFRSRIFM